MPFRKTSGPEHGHGTEKNETTVEPAITEATAEIDEDVVEAVAEQTPSPEEVLQEKLAAAEVLNAELQDKFLRLQADFQNYRKRTAKELSTARLLGMEETLVPFLQVFDHFNMAVQAARNADNMEAIRQGLDLILGEYGKALEELGVEKFGAEGELFNPELHEAISHEYSPEVADGTVIKQWKCGYRIGQKLLRPATVAVSKGPEQAKA